MYAYYPYMRNQMPISLPRQNEMKLMGEGEVFVQPNQATVILGAITESKNLQEAQEINNTALNNIIISILDTGIPRRNIQTAEFRIDIVYDFQDGQQVFRGYRVTNLLSILIEDIDNVGEIVDIAVDNGANTVRDISMSVSNQREHYRQALENAVQDAQEKAILLAQKINVTINQTPIKMKEITSTTTEPPRPLVLGMSTENLSATPIEAGQNRITALVEAIFSY